MKVYLGPPGELEYLPVSLIVYCSYLVQAENLTAVVQLGLNIDVFPQGFPWYFHFSF